MSKVKSIFKTKRDTKTEDDSLLLNSESNFAIQEAYKALRTNVTFSLPGGGAKCIGITSATQGNGKSTNAINLAISFAQIDKRVIVIDCDLRLPTVASKLDIKGEPGLSNLLIGSGKLEDTIQRVESMGIDVLPSGIVPPDATRLLESEQMRVLLEELKERYDYIFIDLPPVMVTPDAVILSKYIDGFLLVARHGVSEYRSVGAMLNQLKFVDAKVIGFVYTGAEVGGHKHYGHYYGSYYGSYEKKQ